MWRFCFSLALPFSFLLLALQCSLTTRWRLYILSIPFSFSTAYTLLPLSPSPLSPSSFVDELWLVSVFGAAAIRISPPAFGNVCNVCMFSLLPLLLNPYTDLPPSADKPYNFCLKHYYHKCFSFKKNSAVPDFFTHPVYHLHSKISICTCIN